MKKLWKSCLAMLLCGALFLGLWACTPQEEQTPSAAPVDHREELDENEPVTLKILSERTMWGDEAGSVLYNKASHFNEVLTPIIHWYEREHPNVEIEVENPSISESTREQVIQQRRVALAAGEVPDIYLQPSLSSIEFYSDYQLIFKDPAQSMTNGWFADISGYYNADQDLHTEELHPAVMEAGVYQGRRYILPLWYSMEVYAVRKDAEKAGEAAELMDGGIQKFLESRLDVPCWNGTYVGTEWLLNYFPQVCDYQSEEVLLKQKELVEYLTVVRGSYDQRWGYLGTLDENNAYVNQYNVLSFASGGGGAFSNEETPSHVYQLERLLDAVAQAKFQEIEIDMVPIRATDGSLTANVSYWGAISAGSKHKAWAYDFLRTLLSPEVQHGEPIHGSDGSVVNTSFDQDFSSHLPGWPVRYKGYVQARWQTIVSEQRFMQNPDEKRRYALGQLELDDSDFPILDVEIDRVRIPGELDRMAYQQLGDLYYRDDVAQVDMEKAAGDFLRDIRYQLAEG